MFEGPHLAAVADSVHAAFPFLDIRTIPKGVEFGTPDGFYYRLTLTGGAWHFDWAQPDAPAGRYPSASAQPVARRGDDPGWAVVNVAEALLISNPAGPVRDQAISALRTFAERGQSDSIRMSATIALQVAGL